MLDEWNKLRGIDALVAEKIMAYECVCDEEPVDCPIHAHNDIYTLWPYSTSFSAAQFVLNRMKMEFKTLCNIHEFPDGWDVYFDGLTTEGRAYEKTLPLAICKAALRAVGVEVEND